ncbi:branched-chain amino acid ABC transporter permease [Sulfitobacter sp. PR48]|uniref:branched-chain amino acid ABC transporter permease n=1 Tax=Sulfitobacter sp. PR48 TaxID=3028383 RepID=UPI00237BB58E|nr:branched-chain amino acid ABC transporter permease [Sulfitobacter sp. PR48]MDD9723604.1 branched-chain amino acid ABC transporter permease [Sulfitobacter sp. PR48]
MTRFSLLSLVAAIALLLAAPLVVYPVLLMKVLCFALFAMSFNLLLGYVGVLSFGHAMFFGGGAYVAGYLIRDVGLPPELAWLGALAAGAAGGYVVGAVALKRSGIYFAMVTLAVAQMAFFFFNSAKFTGGEDGLQNIPRRPLLGFIDGRDDLVLYYVVATIFALSLLLVWRVVHSPFGRSIVAIRDNEPRAISLGYRVQRYKILAFVISASLAALAGAIKAYVFQLASLTDVSWHMSGEVILMTLIGGMSNFIGPVVGGAFVVLMNHFLAPWGEWVVVLQGLIFVLAVMMFRAGIVGTLTALPEVLRQRAAWRQKSKGRRRH